MRNFGLRLKGWWDSCDAWSSASGWFGSTSRAMVRLRLLVAMLAVLMPVLLFLVVSSPKATSPNIITVDSTNRRGGPGVVHATQGNHQR